MSATPAYLWAIVIIGLAAVPFATAQVLRSSAIAAGVGARTALRIALAFGLIWVAWAITTAALAANNVYLLEADTMKPWLGLGFAVPLIAMLALSRVPVVARVLAHPATVLQLTRPHQVRVVGVAFLIALALGELPAAFALPASIGDIAIGLAASGVVRSLRKGSGARRAFWFNVLGLVDFGYALSVGFLGGPGPSQLLHLTPSTQQISMLPLALVPTAGVPVLFALHLISLTKLRAPAAIEAVPA